MAQRLRNAMRGLLQAYGSPTIKRRLWNSEFSRGRWDCLASSSGDVVYGYIEQYANQGSILDLGCGSGSTANEISLDAYTRYTGVDISDVATERARERTTLNRRAQKNQFVQSDILQYTPTLQFDVILFRDSIYYIPRNRIIDVIKRYSWYLKRDGVFIVRMYDSTGKYAGIVDTIQENYRVVEQKLFETSGAFIIVFRMP